MRGMASACSKSGSVTATLPAHRRARHSFVCFQQKQNCLEWRRTSQSHRLASNRTQIPETANRTLYIYIYADWGFVFDNDHIVTGGMHKAAEAKQT